MKKIYFIKCGFKHRVGNFIGAILMVIDGLISILSLGLLYSNFNFIWCFKRNEFGLYEKKK